ncbi:L,D-transpeptidase family protein [Halioxenophilus sp. WMMB6]|uniref:L,D-transpeptidase family protein n=1 Tax=Halioxenophilus sp. WMMB6 TaxID=3073815 RepID=UPI00295F03BA|nr:L,D-transpeptidase family protein [Halioxenophilus sp. WMMB6]
MKASPPKEKAPPSQQKAPHPNDKDQAKAKLRGEAPAGFIMVHGQKSGFGWLAAITQNFSWPNGCIALSNSAMDQFNHLVKVGTPIQIEW